MKIEQQTSGAAEPLLNHVSKQTGVLRAGARRREADGSVRPAGTERPDGPKGAAYNQAAKPENDAGPVTVPSAAKLYAGLGWAVLPVSPETKVPLLTDWPNQATSVPVEIDRLWRRHPRAMVGIVCGPRSGIAVVDVDAKPDEDGITGLQHMERLEVEHGSLANVPTVETPSGGKHLYFRADSLPFPKDENGRIAPKIDLRSATPDGKSVSQVVAPPSARHDGEKYIWINVDSEAELRNLPEAPHWLAFRAGFNETERQIVNANPALLAQIEEAPRARWRAIYDRYCDYDRLIDAAGREQGAMLKGEALALDHPYIAKAIDNVLGHLTKCVNAQNAELNAAAFSIGRLMAGAGLKETGELGRVEDQLFEAAMRLQVLDPNRPWTSLEGKRQARATIRSGLTAGLKSPKDLSHLGKGKTGKNGSSKLTDYTAVVKPFSEIAIERTEWLWPGYVPFGELTAWVGDPKTGKSQSVIDIAARVTNGATFPEVPGRLFAGPEVAPRKPAKVILIAAEDSASRTLKPRLVAAGADMERVFLLDGVKAKNERGEEISDRFTLGPSVAALDKLLGDDREIKLIIIDPINSYCGQTDTNNNTKTRDLLQPLVDLAHKHNVAVLFVGHLNKGKGEVTAANVLYRISGSLAFGAAPRAVLTTVKDPKDPARRFLYMTACNLAQEGPGLVFRVRQKLLKDLPGMAPTEVIATSHVEWSTTETPDLTAVEALSGIAPKSDGNRDLDREAIDFLLEQLHGGPSTIKELRLEAKAENIPIDRVRTAAKRLRVIQEQSGFSSGKNSKWSLPPQDVLDTALEEIAGVKLTDEERAENRATVAKG